MSVHNPGGHLSADSPDCGWSPRPMVGNATRVAAGAMLSLACVLAGAQTPAAAPAASPAASAAAPPPASRAAGDSVTLNFKDADVDSVVGAFGHLLNRTFVIDPRVRGKMTLETPRPVTRAQAWRLLQSALRSQGFAVVETGTLTKIVPEADAKLQSTPVTAGRAPSAAGDQVVTQIFRLNYESATNLVPVLRPLIAPNNTIVAYPSNNSLVVTDYAANLQRIAYISRVIARTPAAAASFSWQLDGEPQTVELAPGEATTVALRLDPRAFSVWDEKRHGWRHVPGVYELRAGRSSRAIRSTARLVLET